MAGIRDATINLTYNLLGKAKEDLAGIRAQLVEIQKLAADGINVGATGGGSSRYGGGGHDPIGGAPTRAVRQAPSGGGRNEANHDFQHLVRLRNLEARQSAADIRTGKADMLSQYRETGQTERDINNAKRQRIYNEDKQHRDEGHADRQERTSNRDRNRRNLSSEERQNRDEGWLGRRTNRDADRQAGDKARDIKRRSGELVAKRAGEKKEFIRRQNIIADKFFENLPGGGKRGGGGRGAGGSGRGPRGGGRSGIATRALLNPGGAAGIQGFMGMGPAGMAVGIPLIANYIARYTMEATTRMSNIGQRGDMSAAQRREGVSEALPIIGGTIRALRELTESLNGTTERIRVIGIRAELQASANQSAARFDPQLIAAQVQQAAAGGQAAAAQAAAVIPVGRFDRSTVAGEQLFLEEQKRLPGQIALAAARRQEMAAQSNVDASQGRMRGLDDRRRLLGARESDAAAEMERIRRVEGDPAAGGVRRPPRTFANMLAEVGMLPNERNAPRVGPPGQQWAAGPQRQRRAALDANRTDINTQQQTLGAATATEGATLFQANNTRAQNASQTRQAEISNMRDDLSIMQNRETAMVGSARNIGMMNPIQRMVGMQAFRHVQQHGWEASPQFMREQMMTVAPNTGNRMATQSGMGSAEQRELQAAGEFGGERRGIEGLRAAMVGLQESIQASVNEDAIRLSNDLLANTVVNNEATIANTAELKRVADELVRIRQQGRTDNPGADQGLPRP